MRLYGVTTLNQQLRGTSCYNGENLQTSVTDVNGTTTAYGYDGEGRRVTKTNNGSTTVFVYDAMGQLASEYGGPTPTDPGRRYLTSDHLGSTRVTTKADGSVDQELDYRPFGEVIGAAAYPQAGGGNAVKFTGHLRDAETGLDFFGARYFSAAQGRFTSPDEWADGIVDAYSGGQAGVPGPLPYADITDPQTINKYAYVRNNPMRYTDPDGHCFLFGEGSPCSFQEFRDTVKDRVVGGLKFEANAILDMTIFGQYIEGRFEPSNAVQKEVMGFGEEIKPEFQQAVAMTFPGPKGEKGGGPGPVSGRVSFNPFKGKTAAQVGEMFEKKGFEARGPDPLAGKGGYVNPKTGRSYHIDPGGTYKKGTEGPHVDVIDQKVRACPNASFPLRRAVPNERQVTDL